MRHRLDRLIEIPIGLWRGVDVGLTATRFSLSAALVGVAMLLPACGSDGGDGGSSSKDAGSKEPIKIGVNVSGTGWTSSYDQPNVQSLKMAAEDYNKKGGILGRKIEIVEAGDNQSKPDISANFAADLIQKQVDVGVTSCDYDVGGPASVEFQNEGILSFSVCASSLLYGPAGALNLGFSAGDSAAGYAAAAAEFGYNKRDWRTAYLLLDNTNAYTKEMCSAFDERWKQLGGTLAGRDTFAQGDQSIQGQISRILALPKPPDVIRLCTTLPGLPATIKQIRAAGIEAPIIAGSESDGTFWHKGAPNMSNFYYTAKGSIFGDDPDQELNAFYKRLNEFEGKPTTDGISVGGYMVLQLLDAAAKKAGSLEGAALAAELQKLKNFDALLGPTTFTSKLHVSVCRPPAIMEATESGKVKFVTRDPITSVPLPESVGGEDLACS
jgi:branched-chain amino acid transport system substrate-binding protein